MYRFFPIGWLSNLLLKRAGKTQCVWAVVSMVPVSCFVAILTIFS